MRSNGGMQLNGKDAKTRRTAHKGRQIQRVAAWPVFVGDSWDETQPGPPVAASTTVWLSRWWCLFPPRTWI